MNILVLMAGADRANLNDEAYPIYLSEIGGKPVIQRLVDSFRDIEGANFVFAVREEDIRKFRVDSVIRQLSDTARLVPVGGSAGAACTALLAAPYIDNEKSLVIVNSDDWLDIDHAEVVRSFDSDGFDAGAVVFPSIHPRYSYVRLDADGLMTEAAEKNPISRNATAGFYWFRRGSDFVEAAKQSIRKDARVNGIFYICPTFNELILKQARIGVHRIDSAKYHPVKSIRQLMQTNLDAMHEVAE